MTFNEKLDAAKALLISKNLPRPSYAPTLVALSWRLGLEIPPPHFAGFIGITLFAGIFFAVVWGVPMWIFFWSRHGTSVATAALIASAVGATIGLAAASYYRASARKHAIPKWKDFNPGTPRST